ncbi:hypothetical protein SESBI_29976 [Sesbania bispinosa]|nr:hypothetical protein SESBI_29976 [Sesbania bispinosa]
MVGVSYRDFADLVTAGERIETMMKAGKFPLSSMEGGFKKGFPLKKKEPEVRYLQSQPFSQSRYPTPAPVSQISTNLIHPTFNQQPCPNETGPQTFHLFQARYTRGGDPQYCEQSNSNHEGGGRVNALGKEGLGIKRVLEIRTPMAEVFEGLKKAGYGMTVPASLMRKEERCDKESVCAYHSGCAGHVIECCWDFKARVQGLLNQGVIQARRKTATREEVNVVEHFILRVPSLNQPSAPEKVVLTIKKPIPFSYNDTHEVPWNYDTSIEVVGGTSENPVMKRSQSQM